MQAEAGQQIELVVQRKECERAAGNGLFCWGIGNAPPRSLCEFVRRDAKIDVVFSLMKSRPKAVDVSPNRVVVWRGYFGLDGEELRLPPNSLVTSRAKASGRAHYALICHAARKLELADHGAFDPAAYLNVSAAGRPVGASQVTALLRRISPEADTTCYRINLRASLAKTFWVKLTDPIELTCRARAQLTETLHDAASMSPTDWLRFVTTIRGERRRRRQNIMQQLVLL